MFVGLLVFSPGRKVVKPYFLIISKISRKLDEKKPPEGGLVLILSGLTALFL